MRYVIIALAVAVGCLLGAILIGGLGWVVIMASQDPNWRFILPIAGVCILIGVLAGAVEYVTDHRGKDGEM